jgi:hypothetical protein
VIDMRTPQKLLLVLEILVCFTPVTLVWLSGVALSPLVILPYLDGSVVLPAFWQGPAVVLGFVGCGLCGLVTLTYLLPRLLGKQRPVAHPALVLTGAGLGVLPVLPLILIPETWDKVWVLLPVAATAHILYLSRRILFPRSARDGLLT